MATVLYVIRSVAVCSIYRAWIPKAYFTFIASLFFWMSVSTTTAAAAENSGIVLRLGYYIPSFPSILLPIFSAHYVAVAGVNSNGSIAICDPKWDITNPNPYEDPILHNDPSIVSHDVYTINESPPYPSISRFWIPDFEIHRRVLVVAAIVISEVE